MNEPNAQGVPLPQGDEGDAYCAFLKEAEDVIREIVPRKQSSEPLSLREPMDKENKVITGNLQGSEGTAPKIVSFPKEYLTLGYEPVELRPLLHDIVLKVLPIIRERKVRFSFDVAGGLPQVRGNSSDLRRAFTDIIRNALDSIPPGGGSSRFRSPTSQRTACPSVWRFGWKSLAWGYKGRIRRRPLNPIPLPNLP